MKKLTLLCTVLLFSTIIITGCAFKKDKPTLEDVSVFLDEQEDIKKQEQLNKDPKEFVQLPEWKNIGPGLDLREMPVVNEQNESINTLAITKIDPSLYSFKVLEDTANPKSVEDWRISNSSEIIINGGYFKKDYTSAGGLIINHEARGTLTYSGKNGYTGMVLIGQDGIELRYLPENVYNDSENIKFAIQTFPTLIKPGAKAGIESDSKKKGKRSIIAKDKSGDILLITTFRSSFSLYSIMNFLLESDLNIDTAFNLDGGPSAGIAIKTNLFEYNIKSSEVPNVISIKTK